MEERYSDHSGLQRTAVVLLMGGSSLLALLTTLTFLVGVGSVVDAHQVSWREVFPVDQPEFAEALGRVVRSYVNPMHTIHYLHGADAWFLFIVGLVAWYWYGVARKQAESPVFFLPALTPTIVGFAFFPLRLLNIAENYPALAELGLWMPEGSGTAVGQATSAVYLGTLLSVICFLGMLWSRTRSGSNRRASRAGVELGRIGELRSPGQAAPRATQSERSSESVL